MTEGSPARALVWSVATAVVLLAWPWLLAWLRSRRPAWFSHTPVSEMADLSAALRRPGRPRLATVAAWTAMVAAVSVLPAGAAGFAADLDAGLLWVAVLAVAAVVLSGPVPPAATAGAVVTILLCVAPPVLRASSLGLSDLVIAQQNGVGNWYILRDPLLTLTGIVFLLAATVIWPAPPRRPAGVEGLLQASLRAGLPLALALLFVVTYLGGWWSFEVFLNGLEWLQTAVKVLVVVALMTALRRRTAWRESRWLERLLPLAALVCGTAAAVWMAVAGAAW